jgi:hypothetical protein
MSVTPVTAGQAAGPCGRVLSLGVEVPWAAVSRDIRFWLWLTFRALARIP